MILIQQNILKLKVDFFHLVEKKVGIFLPGILLSFCTALDLPKGLIKSDRPTSVLNTSQKVWKPTCYILSITQCKKKKQMLFLLFNCLWILELVLGLKSDSKQYSSNIAA